MAVSFLKIRSVILCKLMYSLVVVCVVNHRGICY